MIDAAYVDRSLGELASDEDLAATSCDAATATEQLSDRARPRSSCARSRACSRWRSTTARASSCRSSTCASIRPPPRCADTARARRRCSSASTSVGSAGRSTRSATTPCAWCSTTATITGLYTWALPATNSAPTHAEKWQQYLDRLAKLGIPYPTQTAEGGRLIEHCSDLGRPRLRRSIEPPTDRVATRP